MQPIRISAMSGVVPRVDPQLLTPGQAQTAVNCSLYGGVIEPIRGTRAVFSPTRVASPLTIYRLKSSDGLQRWLTWDRDVDVTPGPVAGDTTQRTYYTGDGEPRVTDYAMATTGGTDYPMASYVLGVFPPNTAPTVTPSGGTGSATSRAYCETFVTEWGEESQPSPASAVTVGKVDDNWALTALKAAPLNSIAVTGGSWSGGVATLTVASSFGLRVGEEVDVTGVTPSGYNASKAVLTEVNSGNVKFALASNPGAWSSGGTISRVAPHHTSNMKRRIYRTLNGVFKFVVELAVATTTYNDTLADTVLGETLPSTDWAMPPTNLKGIMTLQSGLMAGFAGNELCFAEVGKPYAWPQKYRQPAAWPIVAIGGFGSTIIVGTEGNVYTATGNDPASILMIKSEAQYPCVAKRSMASGNIGVVFSSHEGPVLATGAGIDLMARKLFTKKEWEFYGATSIVGVIYGTRYMAAYSSANGNGIILIDLAESIGVVAANVIASAFRYDLNDGKVYLVSEKKIKQWDASDTVRMLFEWKSGEYLLPKPTNLGAVKIDADFLFTAAESALLNEAYNAIVASNNILIGRTNEVLSGTTTNTSNVVTGLASTSRLRRGFSATGTGIPATTYIHSVDSSSQITLTNAATANGTPTLTFTGGPLQARGNINGAAINELVVNGSKIALAESPSGNSLTFTLYVDGVIKFTKEVTVLKQSFKLPSGYKADRFAFGVSGDVPKVRGIVVGENMSQLAGA